MEIKIDRLSKSIGAKSVLRDITLTIPSGSFFVLLGPSGCGKTTLLNLLAGLTDVTAGEIRVGGRLLSSPTRTVPPEERHTGMVFQDFALWPHMTLTENVAFGLKAAGMRRGDLRTRIAEVLSLVRMSEHAGKYPHQLSGGQKQRAAIARSLAGRPQVLLMDEPLSSLDTKLREQMRWELMRITRETGITVVYVTHDQGEALSMADTIVLLNEGVVQQCGSPIELYRRPANPFAAAFLGAANLCPGVVLSCRGGSADMDCGGLTVRAAADSPFKSGDAAALLIRPNAIAPWHPNPPVPYGAVFTATVRNRAFQGPIWHYQLETVPEDGSGRRSLRLECWQEQEWPIGETFRFGVAEGDCRILPSLDHLIFV